MAFLPVILDLVDEMYTSLDGQSKTFSDVFPLMFVPQRTGNGGCGQRMGCPRAQARGCRFQQGGQCQRKACAKPSEKGFEVTFDVSAFKPEEINVKVKDREIQVDGKHEEREDDIGIVSRNFSRRFNLPEEFDADTIATFLSTEGKMTIKASKPQPPAVETSERVIPIQRVPTSPSTEEQPEQVEEAAAEETSKPTDESANKEWACFIINYSWVLHLCLCSYQTLSYNNLVNVFNLFMSEHIK